MFETHSHGPQFKLKRPSLLTCSVSKESKKNEVCQRCFTIPLVTPRKIFVLETLYVFITNFLDFLVKLQLILFA